MFPMRVAFLCLSPAYIQAKGHENVIEVFETIHSYSVIVP
jgi:hypothetical protein